MIIAMVLLLILATMYTMQDIQKDHQAQDI